MMSGINMTPLYWWAASFGHKKRVNPLTIAVSVSDPTVRVSFTLILHCQLYEPLIHSSTRLSLPRKQRQFTLKINYRH